MLHKRKKGALIVGGSGTAKTSTALMFFDTLPGDTMKVKKVTFSAATTPGILQTTIEAELDKRGGKSLVLLEAKMTMFMDDLSMPEKNNWGDQPTLELVRQVVETSGFCFWIRIREEISRTSRTCNSYVLWDNLVEEGRTFQIV